MDIINLLGGPSAVARMVDCKPPSVTEWRRRGIPPERCPALERAIGGRVTCEQMRPDVCWVRLPDAEWPWHPNGRPLRDDTRDTGALAPSTQPGHAA
jgi:DNA-binding transcriptional regulator YdaS (Cro superfamily)